MPDLPKVYSPKDVEEKWYRIWEKEAYFNTQRDPQKTPYTIVIPPPNVTGILHMGHALNNTLQDILIRWKRMEGTAALWVPGTDHAGIATQNVVEKALAKEGKTRHDLGREKFVEKVWRWREEYGGTIIKQLKRLGASCDWSRERFTMDEGLSRSVQEVFIRLYEKGLIYRGHYIINWCPRCQTALSDEEAPHQELKGHLYYIRYPIQGEESFIVVATTRPETLLGDTAVAINPEDGRYRTLRGKTILLPILSRPLQVIEDEFVDPVFGTGVVKVTPAHDPNDFLMGQSHKLPSVNVMNPDGTMNEAAGPYKGLDRFECRKKILSDLAKEDLLEKTEDHLHAVGHCYRCNTVIEPRLSLQWFVKMKPLAEPAIRVVKEGKVTFHPPRWTKVYLDWMENIRDWCISRQIWWGHRIPAWVCVGDVACKRECKEPIVSRTVPKKCPHCGNQNLRQEEDVLDTWFSSWLWPFSTLGWPEENEDLRYFYPTNTLVTAPEILFFWVARMIMAGLEFRKEIPFRDVYIHGTVRAEGGKKMSKSLGNIIDPIEIIEEFGADALRFSLMVITATGTDVYLSEQKFLIGRNFANKIWNAARLILPKLGEDDVRGKLPDLELGDSDKELLSKLNRLIEEVSRSLKEYRFNEGATLLYEFFWHDFCDWYLEFMKVRPESENEKIRATLHEVLASFLKLLHPWMPFITEELFQKLPGSKGSLVTTPWPKSKKEWIDDEVERKMEFVKKPTNALRNLRSELRIPPNVFINKIEILKGSPLVVLLDYLPFLRVNAKVDRIEVRIESKKPKDSATLLVDNHPIHVHLEGIIDLKEERKRVSEEIEKRKSHQKKAQERLSDEKFLSSAPKEIVEQHRQTLQTIEEGIQKLKGLLQELE